MCKNKLIIAAAGSGKTTYLVEKALAQTDRVLITTYTEANEAEIKKKIIEKNKFIPPIITVQTWFSFLLQHGVRPYQSLMNEYLHSRKIGFLLSENKSGFKVINEAGYPVYWGEGDFFKYYFTKNLKIYSDKISKFIVECNKISNNELIDRIDRIYPNIYIDEIQDLAGYELEILKLLFESESRILMIGDPRQVVYLTHHSSKHPKYKNGNIKVFLTEKCASLFRDSNSIDETSFNVSHRNNKDICDYSSKLYPEFPTIEPCDCEGCRNLSPSIQGIFLVREADIDEYLDKHKPRQLRWNASRAININYPSYTFGKAKGLTFDHVLIYPTGEMINWIKNNVHDLKDSVRSKFYVGITRARHSVGIVYDYSEDENFENIKKFK